MIATRALLALLVTSAAAEPLFLVDEDGARHGPFELRNTAELPLGGHVYKVERLPNEAQALVDVLKATKLPGFRFADARLPELVRFVSENAVPQNAALAGVAFLIVGPRPVIPAPPPATAPEPAAEDPATSRPETAASEKPVGEAPAGESPSARGPESAVKAVSFEAQALSAWDLLNLAANLFGHRVEIDAKAVRLVHPRVPDGPLLQRTYNVLPTLVERMASFRTERGGPMPADPHAIAHCFCYSEPTSVEGWKTFFSDLGVSWPDGSSVQHMPTIGKLVVVNTMTNLRRFEAVLRALNVTPKQVEIDCQFVAIPREALEKTARSGRIPSATILALVADGTAKLLASPKVVTKNGSEATVKAVLEYIYPTEFTVKGQAAGDADAEEGEPERQGAFAVEPCEFETREVGVILQVVPDVTPDGQMINLTLSPQRVSAPAWKDYSIPAVGPVAGTSRPAPTEQPFFPVESVATSVQVYDGVTMVMGGGAPSPDGRTFTYLLVTATLVAPSGREVRKDDPDPGAFFPVPPAAD